MIEVKVIPRTGRPQESVICIDGEEWRLIHSTIFGKKPALPQGCEDVQSFESVFTQSEIAAAKRYALRRLAARSYPSTSLRKLLITKHVSVIAADEVIAWCTKQGFINDNDWISSFVRAQAARRLGPNRIIQKLRAKGVPEHLAEESIRGVGQQEQIRHLLQSRYGSKDLNQPKDKQKVIAALIRKGFEWEVIQEIIYETRRVR